jgi:hypothetical protein
MATIVNNPPTSGDGGSGFLVGVVVLIGFFLVLVYFGLPELRRLSSNQQNSPLPQIVVPDKLDVNINQTK